MVLLRTVISTIVTGQTPRGHCGRGVDHKLLHDNRLPAMVGAPGRLVAPGFAGAATRFFSGAGNLAILYSVHCYVQRHLLRHSPCIKKMFSKRFGVTSPLLRILVVALLTVVVAPAPSDAAKAPQSIAVLDSLTGDSTIVQGNVVYVDFWASWCIPCRLSFPWMAEISSKYSKQGLQIITVNVDRDHAAAEKFLKSNHSTLPVVYDPEGKLAKLYDLQVMPTSFVYGRDGVLRTRKEGFIPEEKGPVESLIRKLLEEKPSK